MAKRKKIIEYNLYVDEPLKQFITIFLKNHDIPYEQKYWNKLSSEQQMKFIACIDLPRFKYRFLIFMASPTENVRIERIGSRSKDYDG